VRFADTAGVQLRGELPIAPDVSGIAPNRRDREQLLELITDWNKAQILSLIRSTS
jgi:hypothetical protein